MGERGQIPKRSEQRRRVNKPPVEVTRSPGTVSVQPPPDPGWHPLALAWYRALADSGQSRFYEPSDWATAQVLAHTLSDELKPRPLVVDGELRWVKQPMRPGVLASWLKGSTVLLVTEGDRRRSLLELQRPTPEVGEGEDVTRLDDVRARLGRTS